MHAQSLSCVSPIATPWTIAHQASLSVGISLQEYWSGLPFPSLGDLPNPGIKPGSPTLQADALPSELPGKLYGVRKCSNFILLHVAVQFSQHHLLKRLSLPHCIYLSPFLKNNVPIGTWVYFLAFYLVPLVYIPVFVPAPYCLDSCSFVLSQGL